MNKKYVFGIIALFIAMSFISCDNKDVETSSETDPVSVKVMSDIDSIGDVELEDKDLIEKIERTYVTLTDKQKEQVNNYATLLTARDELDELIKADEKAKEEAKKKEEKQKPTDSFSAADYTIGEAFAARAIIALKNVLKNPESLQIIQYTVGATSDNVYVFMIEYSAQNGFGGYDRAFAAIDDGNQYNDIGIKEPITGLEVITESIFKELNEPFITDAEMIAERAKQDGIRRDKVDKVIAKYEETKDIEWLNYAKI